MSNPNQDVLHESISTRLHYAQLRRAVEASPTPTDLESARATFERLKVQIAILCESDVYAALRGADRRQIDDLKRRINNVLKVRAGAETLLPECKRLFLDLVGFAELTRQISHRHELVESDTRIVNEVYETLALDREIPTRLRARLDMLAGLDDELDMLIECGEESGSAFTHVIARLRTRLLRPTTGQFLRSSASLPYVLRSVG